MKKYLFGVSVVILLVFSGCGAAKIYNVAKPTSKKSFTITQMKESIEEALQSNNWEMLEAGNGKIVAKFIKGKFQATVDIEYKNNTYSINYNQSQNLKYNGRSIHKIYNIWVKKLEKRIDTNLYKVSRGMKLNYVKSKVAPLSASIAKQPQAMSCQNTFKVTGSIWKGRVITAKEVIASISKEEAVQQAAGILSGEGFIIDSTAPKVGLISAHEVKSGGHTLPISLMFSNDQKSGVVAKLTVSTPAGESFSIDSMKNYMCGNVMSKIHSTGYKSKNEKSSDNVLNVTSNRVAKRDVRSRLEELQKLYKDKLITKKEFDLQRGQIIKDL